MGRKKTDEKPKEEAVVAKEPEKEAEKKEEEKPEDPPVVKELKELDDKYLEIEREYERAVQELQIKYTEKQAPLLDERFKLLQTNSADGPKTGTPGLRGFWLQAMKNHPALEEQIEEWDEPVLEHLTDIRKSFLDEKDLHKGFRLEFVFAENPYFAHDVIWKEYHTKETSPYTGEMDTTEIKVLEIQWNAGKNVTVETIKKKAKGGGAKKAKQKGKEKEEPRDSFFRHFFRNLKPDMPVPDDVNLDDARQHLCEESDDEDDEHMLELLMENDYEIGCSIRDQVIPFAVRWYTGEARPEGYDDDEDDEDEEEEDDDEDDDEESSEDEPAPKKKGQPKKQPAPQADKKNGGDGGQQECKQQ